MNGHGRKPALIQEIAAILRVDVAGVQCLDALSNTDLEALREVFKEAIDAARNE